MGASATGTAVVNARTAAMPHSSMRRSGGCETVEAAVSAITVYLDTCVHFGFFIAAFAAIGGAALGVTEHVLYGAIRVRVLVWNAPFRAANRDERPAVDQSLAVWCPVVPCFPLPVLARRAVRAYVVHENVPVAPCRVVPSGHFINATPSHL